MHTEEVPIYIYIYIPINQLHKEGKTMYAEEVPIYTNQTITQARLESVHRRGTYIYQSINYTEEVRKCIHNMYLSYTNPSITQRM